MAAKRDWTASAVASAAYTVNAVAALSDEEVMAARNAIARAKEVDADYYDPDNFRAAQRLLEEGLDARAADPAAARAKLAAATDSANLAFDNAVERGAADLARRMEAARQRLLALEADKFLPSNFNRLVQVADPPEPIFEPVASRRMQAKVEEEVLGRQPLNLDTPDTNGTCPLPQAIDVYAERIRRILDCPVDLHGKTASPDQRPQVVAHFAERLDFVGSSLLLFPVAAVPISAFRARANRSFGTRRSTSPIGLSAMLRRPPPPDARPSTR